MATRTLVTRASFDALGRFDVVTQQFSLLDPKSDMGGNLFDAGNGYAAMHMLDPVRKRMIFTITVFEGDQDPSRLPFSVNSNKRGWFGTLALPRLIEVDNVTHDDGSHDIFLRTPPLPELTTLRVTTNEPSSSFHGSVVLGDLPSPIALRASSFEVNASFPMPAAGSRHWNLGLRVFWSDDDS
eukprot:COSAG05_NODE_7713_length_777_cov_0.921829_1_plen_182_part_01